MAGTNTSGGGQVHPLYVPLPAQEATDGGRLILRDGSSAELRRARPADQAALSALFQRLSPESRYRRFFSSAVPDSAPSVLCDQTDPAHRLTLVVTRTIAEESQIVATASYISERPGRAEVAFAVDDAFQGKGLGTLLLERLAVLAARHGITAFEALTLTENAPMLQVFRDSGLDIETHQEQSLTVVSLSTVPTEQSTHESERRDRVATVASLRPFFHPNAVAVIGASSHRGSIGYRVVEALVAGHFQGAVYPVNPKGGVVCSIRAYPSVQDLPEAPDLAIVTAPPQAILGIVDECAAAGVRALVVVTAGFAEVPGEGRDLQARLVEKVRGYGMRMIGPNCLGIATSDPAVQLNASFSPVGPTPGSVAMASQSGALGLAILALTRELKLGLSSFVSLGNKGDVSGNDLLQYWEEDEQTSVILLYLESFGNPRRFVHLARRVSRRKPIVIVKGGRTATGQRAAGSHTAALAASDTAVEALVHQSGVLRAESLDEMFHLATALSHQPLPKGRRVGILTNAGGPAILCADACEAGGLTVPELSEVTRAWLSDFLPPAASLSNPVDMIASANEVSYQRAIEAMLPSDEIDALVVIYIPVGIADADAVRAGILAGVAHSRATGGADKPVLVCWMAGETVSAPVPLGESERLPVHAFPETAARVLCKMADYATWRAQPAGVIPDFADIQPRAAQEICREALVCRGAGWLSVAETRAVLEAMALPVAPGGVATTAAEAVALAQYLGFPVAVKLASHRLVHKTELGGVQLNLRDASAVRAAFETIRERAGEEMEGVLVQPMVAGGVEVMMGMVEEPRFGPLLAFGLGGIHVEILKDVCFRMTPLTQRDAAEMVRAIRGHRLLAGYRNLPPSDVGALEEALLRLSRLVEEVPEIRELDLNPLFAFPEGQGCTIVDARIRVGEPSAG